MNKMRETEWQALSDRFEKICLTCDQGWSKSSSHCPDCKAVLISLRFEKGYASEFELIRRYDDLYILTPASGRSYLYRGLDRNTKQQVVIKVLDLESGRDDAFARQVAMLRVLEHPKIASLVEFGEFEDGSPFYVTAYHPGEPIYRHFGKMSLEQFYNTFMQVADAMQYAHDHNVFHWDLKPADILIDASDTVHVLDFGKGMPWLHGDNREQQQTELGDVFGEPGYIAPETCKLGEMDARSNIYSLGCIMYACWQGHPPVPSGNWITAAIFKLGGKYIPLRPDVAAVLPKKLQELIFKCMSVEPAQRCSSMSEVKQALKDCQNDRR